MLCASVDAHITVTHISVVKVSVAMNALVGKMLLIRPSLSDFLKSRFPEIEVAQIFVDHNL